MRTLSQLMLVSLYVERRDLASTVAHQKTETVDVLSEDPAQAPGKA